VLTNSNERREIVTEIIGIHQVGENDREKVEPDKDIGYSSEFKIGFLEEEGEVTVTTHEEVGCDEDSNRIVDSADLASSEIVIDEDRDLHPSFPLVCLITIEKSEIFFDRFHCDDSGDEREDGKGGEGDSVILLVLLQEEIGSIGDEEEGDGETENSEGEEVFLVGEEVVKGRCKIRCMRKRRERTILCS